MSFDNFSDARAARAFIKSISVEVEDILERDVPRLVKLENVANHPDEAEAFAEAAANLRSRYLDWMRAIRESART